MNIIPMLGSVFIVLAAAPSATTNASGSNDREASRPTTAPTNEKQAVEDAIAAVEKLGGRVQRDSNQPHAPVIAVVLMRTPANDRDLALLENFKELQRLNLGLTEVTDVGMAHAGVAVKRPLDTRH